MTNTNANDSAKVARARKMFVDAANPTVEVDIEKANALSYTSLNYPNGEEKGKEVAGKTVVLDVRKMDPKLDGVLETGSPVLMLALFGLTTQATNFASFNRKSAKAEDRFADDADAVESRFKRIEPGNWGDRSGGGFGIDVATLAEAVQRASGKTWDDAKLTAWIAKREAEPESKRTFRNNAEVAPIYDELMRAKKTVSGPDLATLLADDDE